jgi:hypothetical protein
MSKMGSWRDSDPVARGLLLGVDPHVDAHREETGLLLEGESSSDHVHSPPGRLQVLPLRHRQTLQPSERDLFVGQIRQCGPDPPSRVRAPEAEQPVQPLPVSEDLGLGQGHVELRLAMDHDAVLELEVVDGPGLVLPRGEVRRRLGDVTDERQRSRELLARLDREVGLLDLGGQVEHLAGDPQLGLLQLRRRELLAGGLHEHVEDVQHQGELRVGPPSLAREAHEPCELRVLEPAGLRQLGLGHPQLLEGGLQGPVVDERDPHCRVGREVALKELGDGSGGGLAVGLAARPCGALAGPLFHQAFDVGERGTRVHAGAPAHEHGGSDGPEQAPHRWLGAGLGAGAG